LLVAEAHQVMHTLSLIAIRNAHIVLWHACGYPFPQTAWQYVMPYLISVSTSVFRQLVPAFCELEDHGVDKTLWQGAGR